MIRSMLQKGTFLVASSSIDTPLLHQSVILICEMRPEGTFALIINKPINLEPLQRLHSMGEVCQPHVAGRAAGPEAPEGIMLLHRSTQRGPNMHSVLHDVQVGGDEAFYRDIVERQDGPQLLVCFGHYMWGPGQMEAEVLEGMWLPVAGSSDDIFDIEPEMLWPRLYLRAHGPNAFTQYIPDDLSLN